MANQDKFIFLKNVRVSFPHLFEKPFINGEQAKCGATLMLDPKTNANAIKEIQMRINELIKDKFKGKKLPTDKICLRDGEDKGRPEYEGLMVLNANNNDKPVVLDARANVITDPSKNPIYAGCYVNAKITLWAMDNNYGKRICATLVAIQFAADGEALTDSYISQDQAVEGFEAVTDEEPEDIFA